MRKLAIGAVGSLGLAGWLLTSPLSQAVPEEPKAETPAPAQFLLTRRDAARKTYLALMEAMKDQAVAPTGPRLLLTLAKVEQFQAWSLRWQQAEAALNPAGRDLRVAAAHSHEERVGYLLKIAQDQLKFAEGGGFEEHLCADALEYFRADAESLVAAESAGAR